MNKNSTLTIFMALSVLLGREKASAQSVTGSWVKTSEIVTHADGMPVNMLEKLKKTVPCLGGIVYTFSSGGKISEDASGCPAPVQKTVASINRQSAWKQTGDKITLDVSGDAAPVKHEVFHLHFNGNDEMVWTFLYAENPGTPNPLKTKEMVTTYHRK